MNNEDHNSYFDENYFQRGGDRGTAYKDYVRSAPKSAIFKEIAQSIASIFPNKKCLEIGCATGSIVKNLNDMGVEAYGIDVSEWAVANRLHGNVILSGAQDIPFPDEEFDLVFSSHSLEHIPQILLPSALNEMSRVTKSTGYQFHMLPIIGTHPFDYDHEEARRALRADPTHNILETMEWWIDRWNETGWYDLGLNITFYADTSEATMSSGQYVLHKERIDPSIFTRTFDWNKLVHRKLFADCFTAKSFNEKPRSVRIEGELAIIGSDGAPWSDMTHHFPGAVNLTSGEIDLFLDLQSSEPCSVRLALVDESKPDERGVFEHWIHLQPGFSTVHIKASDLQDTEGSPSLTKISWAAIGGHLGEVRLRGGGSIILPSETIPLFQS